MATIEGDSHNIAILILLVRSMHILCASFSVIFQRITAITYEHFCSGILYRVSFLTLKEIMKQPLKTFDKDHHIK